MWRKGFEDANGITLATISSTLPKESNTIFIISIYGFCVSNIDFRVVISSDLNPINISGGLISFLGILKTSPFLYLEKSNSLKSKSLFTNFIPETCENFFRTAKSDIALGLFIFLNIVFFKAVSAIPKSPFTTFLIYSILGIMNEDFPSMSRDFNIALAIGGILKET